MFSLTIPYISAELLLAFCSPGEPSVLLVIPVTVEANIEPVSASNLLLVDFSNISCPRAPKLLFSVSI